MKLEDHFRVVKTGSQTWGNVFLTTDWTLYIDMTNQQHDASMDRLGICIQDVLISGSVRTFDGQTDIWFRSSPGEDHGDITNEESMKLQSAIRVLMFGEERERKFQEWAQKQNQKRHWFS